MRTPTGALQAIIVRDLDAFARELELYPDDTSVWATAPGVTNSAGTLALHVAGNLQHYVGKVLGGTGYVRNRDDEFGRRSGTREELAGELRTAAQVIRRVLPRVTEADLGRDFPEQVGGVTMSTDLFLHHASVHLAHHLGQVGYLRRIVTGDTRSAGAMSLKALAV